MAARPREIKLDNKHVPISHLKKYLEAYAAEPLMLMEIFTHVARLMIQKKVLGRRSLAEFTANIERMTKGV